MADLGTIGIAIEVRGREALRQIENDMTAVDRSAKSAARSFEVFERAGLKTAETFRYVSDAAKKRLADEQRITQELVKQRTAAEQLARANAQKFQSQIGSNLGLGARGISAGASASAFEAEIERLRQKYDKVYAASQLYERSLNELNQAHRFGVLSAKQHEAAVESLNLEYQQFANSAEGAVLANNRFSQHVNQAGRGLNSFGMYAQQVGYQVGDFFVQIQSGTNVLVAFGQQATQLAGLIPGVWGAAIGIGISLATAIGAAFMRTRESANSAAEGILTLADAQKQLNDVSGDYALKLEMLRFGVDTQAEAVALKSILDLTKQIQDLNKEYQETDSLSRRQNIAEEVQALKVQLSTQQEIVDEVNAKRDAYEKALAINEQMLAIELGHARAAGQTAAAARQIDFTSAVSSAAQLAEQLGISVSHASSMLAMGFGRGKPVIFDPRDPNYDPIAAEMVRVKEDYGRVSPFDPSRQPRATSGGGGRSSQLKKEIELTKELTQAEKDRQTILKSIEGSLESGFMSMIDGTKSVKDAFKSMAREILKELYRVLVVQRLVGGISNALSFATGPSTGSFGLPFGGAGATGGSMIPGKSYLVGENGPELVIPRHSGTVVNANQTANAMGGGGSVTVNNNISVTGSDAAMVRTEIAKMIPQITNATKAAVIDAKQRGGQMGAAFR